MKFTKLYDAADGSATPGRVFTASIPNENINPGGSVLSYIMLGLKGAVSTAAVVIEDFAGLLSEYVLFVGAETRIKGDAADLAAISHFYEGVTPRIGENTDATGNDFLGGIKIPVYAPVEASKPMSHAATRTAVTNIGTETIAADAAYDSGEANRKPIHAVRVNHTTAGSAGVEQLSMPIPPVGVLKALLLDIPNGFADGNIDISVQRIKIMRDGVEHSQLNALSAVKANTAIDYVTPSPLADLLRPFLFFDFRDSGINVKDGAKWTLALDVQDASDAIGIIPILEMA